MTNHQVISPKAWGMKQGQNGSTVTPGRAVPSATSLRDFTRLPDGELHPIRRTIRPKRGRDILMDGPASVLRCKGGGLRQKSRKSRRWQRDTRKPARPTIESIKIMQDTIITTPRSHEVWVDTDKINLVVFYHVRNFLELAMAATVASCSGNWPV